MPSHSAGEQDSEKKSAKISSWESALQSIGEHIKSENSLKGVDPMIWLTGCSIFTRTLHLWSSVS
jgi:hypothetical protein